ncbi:MAG: DUF3313 family protein [Chitinophagaceae bacterium]|nr:DUF3313 family protein [Rubrivivax sp.]
MKPNHVVLAVSLTAVLAACGTTMSNLQPGGYLSSYDGLQTTNANSRATITSAVTLNPALIQVVDVQWRAADEAGLDEKERAELLVQLRHELIQQVARLPAAADGRPAQLRAAITRVETVSPALNTLGILLLVGPLDRGGVAVEMEAIDPATGKQLAAMRLGYFAPLSDLSARFSRLAPAQIAIQRAVKDFTRLLTPQEPTGQVQAAG